MTIKQSRSFAVLLLACVFAQALTPVSEAAVSKTSKRIIRPSSAVTAVVSDLRAAALSTTSIQWNWSTGTFTGIDGFHIYLSTQPGVLISSASLTAGTSFYVDSGLGVNKVYTRWITAYQGADEGSDSQHIEKHTFALPPDTITLSTVTAESVYVTWHFSSATAYAIECSTNGGADYVRNREAFVPWQTIPLLSNKNYLIRMGAVNGDDELTPGTYSVIKTTITPPLTVPALSAVALSSFTIQWQWSTGTFTGTDISGYRLYHSTTSSDDVLPADDYAGEIVQTILAPGTTFWTETFVDGSTTAVAANSRHTRWIKAVGNIHDPFNGNLYLESQKKTVFQKYTYAIAPATTTVVYPDPAPWWVAHVWDDQVKLIWVPRLAVSEASKYLVEYSTVAGFAVAVSSELTAGNPDTVTGLTENTKYDFRIGAINGDNEQTPANGLNPFAYSQAYKLITSPRPPSAYSCAAFTDTALHCTWSTAAYVNPGYIDGYFVGELHHRMVDGVDTLYWDPWETVDGADSHEYSLDYMLTNSTHTISIWVEQTDPDWVAGNYHYDHNEREYYYNNWGSYRQDTDGATFATPPNDVVFDTVGAHAVGMWWKEPVVPATRYSVARSTNIGEDGPWVFVSSVTGSHYNDVGTLPAGLTPSTTYSYRIGAINLLGQPTIGLSENTGGMRRDYSFVSSTITRHTAPLFSGVPVGTTSITWSWSDTGGVSGVQSYNLYTSTDGLLRTFPATTASWAETGLPGVNANYIRRIRSIASDGLGDVAEASTYTWTNAPTGLSTSAAGAHYLALGWAQNESSAYRIDRSTDGLNWAAVKNWSDVFVSTSFTDTGLHYATTYYYAVLGYNHGGIVSLSSTTTLAMPGMTLDLPARFTPVFSTAAVTQSKTALLPGVGWITLEFPPGAAPVDGYISISTDAATNPVGVTAGNLNTAAGKLAPNRLLGGSMVELYYFDFYGSTITSAFSGPVKITITYPDVNGDDIVDGITPQMSANTLKLFNLDTSGLVWNQDRNSLLDKTARSVSSNIFHFSFYALGSITSTVGTLTEMFAYPNPYRPGTSGEFGQSAFGDGIVFEALPAGAKIRIYSLSGAQVAELSDDDGDGRCLWNTRNQDGAKAASGVYLYIVTGSGSSAKKTGKVAIIR